MSKLTLDLIRDAQKRMMPDFGAVDIIFRSEEPEWREYRRSWKERLFTRPWKPFKKTKMVFDEAAAQRNEQIYKITDTIDTTCFGSPFRNMSMGRRPYLSMTRTFYEKHKDKFKCQKPLM